MEDFGDIQAGIDTVKGAAAALVGWWVSKFGTDRKSKIFAAAIAFACMIILISVLQSVFGG